MLERRCCQCLLANQLQTALPCARVQTTFDSEVLDLLMERDSIVGAYAAAQDQLAALTSDNR